MTEELIAELLEEYLGKKVKEEYSVWGYLDAKKLYEQKVYVRKEPWLDRIRILTMGMQIEFDDNDCISDINLYFYLSREGESGAVVADPEDYWEYSDCYDHASGFIEKVLEE